MTLKIGDRVEYITNIDWGPSIGCVGVIQHIHSDGAFSVKLDGEKASYYTRRSDVCPVKPVQE